MLCQLLLNKTRKKKNKKQTWRNLKCKLLNKGSQSERLLQCQMSNVKEYDILKKNYGKSKKVSLCLEFTGGGWDKQMEHRGF